MADEAPPTDHAQRWTHRWVTKLEHAERYNTICRIVNRPLKGKGAVRGYFGAMGMSNARVTVEFADGTKVEAARWAIRSLSTWKPGGGARKGEGYGKPRVGS